jgi:shikimate dehydrogenase
MNKSIKICVIGYPLGHTLSPVIHNHWFEKLHIDGRYEARPVDPADFEKTAANLANDYNGFNVTLPYKEQILPFCTTLDEAAQKIGAVNTVVIDRDGNMQGRNTDAYGFAQNIKQNAPAFDWKRGSALVLGAGGAARAILHALQTNGVPEILIANRTKEKADMLAARFGARVVAWNDVAAPMKDANVLVNATSLGMRGQPALGVNIDSLPAHACVCDIVYAPLKTRLLKDAKARGLTAVTGIGMLLHLAALAFEAWTGMRPAIDAALETLVLEKLA